MTPEAPPHEQRLTSKYEKRDVGAPMGGTAAAAAPHDHSMGAFGNKNFFGRTMKKKLLFLIFSMVCLLAFILKPEEYRYVYNESFSTGEVLNYRVHYGVINAAEATMEISNNHFFINNRACYKIDIYGRTTGFFDLILRVRDNWGAYVDTTSIIPHKAYRYIQEGKYRKNEVINFNHQEDKATVLKLHKETRKLKEKEEYKVPDNILDIVGGYYFLRTLDYSKLKEGDEIEVNGFFDEKVYDLKVKVLGREELKTKLGTFRSIIIAPRLPDNDFFSEGEPVKVWISDDKNKVPLKIKAELAVGALEIDIKEMANLRN